MVACLPSLPSHRPSIASVTSIALSGWQDFRLQNLQAKFLGDDELFAFKYEGESFAGGVFRVLGDRLSGDFRLRHHAPG